MPFLPQEPEDNSWTSKLKPVCVDREHFPPSLILLPPGKHIWVCPSCGKQTVVYGSENSC